MTNNKQTQGSHSGIRLRTVSAVLAFVVVLMPAVTVVVLAAQPAQAQTFSVLYTFTGPTTGAQPYAGVIRDTAGNLYGTTWEGGLGQWCPNGCGVVFKLTGGEETVLHNFTGRKDGIYPYYGNLIRDHDGNLYGTTYEGGAFNAGTVFKIRPTGKEVVLYTFTGGVDGGFPAGGLAIDSAGSLYGTTSGHGTGTACPYGCGTVFEVDKTGKETVLYSFAGGTGDGAYPWAGVLRDRAGNLYGTTLQGGTANRGTVFKIDSTGVETVLHNFTGSDGSLPWAGVIEDRSGNLYGASYAGGANYAGAVYKIAANGTFSLLHSFSFEGTDGQYPQGGLVRDAKGNLYGTTFIGGSGGSGTVFKLDTSENETILYSFMYSTDGGYPSGVLALDAAGNVYGTTQEGGDPNCECGTVFEITAASR